MTEAEATTAADVDPCESPFATPAVEGLPFDRESDEARAIDRILHGADDNSIKMK